MSTLKVNSIQSTSGRSMGVVYGQASYDSAGTFVLNGGTNCSSLSDNGQGKFQFNYSSTVPNINYAISGAGSYSGGTWTTFHSHGNNGALYTPTTSNFRWDMVAYNGSNYYDSNRADVLAVGA